MIESFFIKRQNVEIFGEIVMRDPSPATPTSPDKQVNLINANPVTPRPFSVESLISNISTPNPMFSKSDADDDQTRNPYQFVQKHHARMSDSLLTPRHENPNTLQFGLTGMFPGIFPSGQSYLNALNGAATSMAGGTLPERFSGVQAATRSPITPSLLDILTMQAFRRSRSAVPA